jgi:hypothetical protein
MKNNDLKFELEQAILDAWHVVDDIDTVYHHSDHRNEDQLMNLLLGIKELYQLKFEKLFDTFEQYTKEQRSDLWSDFFADTGVDIDRGVESTLESTDDELSPHPPFDVASQYRSAKRSTKKDK